MRTWIQALSLRGKLMAGIVVCLLLPAVVSFFVSNWFTRDGDDERNPIRAGKRQGGRCGCPAAWGKRGSEGKNLRRIDLCCG
ncbi:hypothetical protein [Paenibacillus elgii]|uniref:hypothetical protein n=1 Tax=Paenibacillus elgii TaxID=189691 RepID=UPI001ED8D93F|nr:hypothetical protein [Paenibacillus elgii]